MPALRPSPRSGGFRTRVGLDPIGLTPRRRDWWGRAGHECVTYGESHLSRPLTAPFSGAWTVRATGIAVSFRRNEHGGINAASRGDDSGRRHRHRPLSGGARGHRFLAVGRAARSRRVRRLPHPPGRGAAVLLPPGPEEGPVRRRGPVHLHRATAPQRGARGGDAPRRPPELADRPLGEQRPSVRAGVRRYVARAGVQDLEVRRLAAALLTALL